MDIDQIKKDFPVFEHEPELVYLDTAASALTAASVVDAVRAYYERYPVNVARGVYGMSERATQAYEQTRTDVARFIGATCKSLAFTSGTTQALNMVAHGLAHRIAPDANIVVTAADHHANFVPWQRVAQNVEIPSLHHCCEGKNLDPRLRGDDTKRVCAENDRFRVVGVTADGQIDMDDLRAKVDAQTAVFAFPYVSNVLGTIFPVKELIAEVKKINPAIITVVDAAQAAAHIPIDVTDLGCDFLAFSGHKLYGPTGVGVLYGKDLSLLEPLVTGGEMVSTVTCDAVTFKDAPHHLEAGTPPIAQVIGLGAAVRYLESIGMDAIVAHDAELTAYALDRLSDTFGDTITIYGSQTNNKILKHVQNDTLVQDGITHCTRSGLLSFSLDGIHPHDIAHILDTEHAIAIRAGAHCAQPLHAHLGVSATARASFGIYTTRTDIDALVSGLAHVQEIFVQ